MSPAARHPASLNPITIRRPARRVKKPDHTIAASAHYAPEGAGILEKVRQQNYLAPKKRNLMKFA